MPLRTKNHVALLGVVGNDPETRNLQGGGVLAKFPIGLRSGGKNDDGTYRDDIEWFTVTVWGRDAEIVSKHLKKGDDVHVDGYLKKNVWTDTHGQKRYDTEVHVKRVILLGGKGEVESVDQEPSPEEPKTDNDSKEPSNSSEGPAYDPQDDLPF